MEDAENLSPVTSAKGVGDAVGIPGRQWYVAFVGQNTEKSCREKLQRLGYDCYVATQDEIHQWRNGRRHHVERVVISTIVFVHATEDERRDIVNLPFIKYFMTDKAALANDFGIHPLAVVTDKEMQKLRFMLYHADQPVEFNTAPVHEGDAIRVVRGTLKGFEGHVVNLRDGSPRLVVRIGSLGCATLSISLEDIEKR